MAETILKDIGLYKNRLLTLLLESDDICQALAGPACTAETVYGQDGNDEDYGLVYKQIFPYLYIDDTQDEVLPYLCVEVDVPDIPTSAVKEMKIIIWCYCHKKCMKYTKKGYSGTRSDILADMVERQLGDSERFGIGKLSLASVTYLTDVNHRYYGRQLVFTAADFRKKRR